MPTEGQRLEAMEWSDRHGYVYLKALSVLCDCYVKCKSARMCQRKFRRTFPDIQVPHRNTIQSLVKKLKKSGVLIDKKTRQAVNVQY
jgi:hypothetical protein